MPGAVMIPATGIDGLRGEYRSLACTAESLIVEAVLDHNNELPFLEHNYKNAHVPITESDGLFAPTTGLALRKAVASLCLWCMTDVWTGPPPSGEASIVARLRLCMPLFIK